MRLQLISSRVDDGPQPKHVGSVSGRGGGAGTAPDSGSGGAGGSAPDAGTGGTAGASGGDSGSSPDVRDASACRPAGTITVTNTGSTAYRFDGNTVNNPSITLCRGSTYTFAVNAAGHPFYVRTEAGANYDMGVTGNGASNGNVVFTVPQAAPARLIYVCSLHASMRGTILIVD